MIAKLEGHKVLNNKTTTKHTTSTNNGSNNKQRINNSRINAIERTAAQATGGLNALYWHKTVTLDSVVVKTRPINA